MCSVKLRKLPHFYIFVAFHIFVAGSHREFKFGTWIEAIQSKPMDDKPSLKLAWLCHVTQFKFCCPITSQERLKLVVTGISC